MSLRTATAGATRSPADRKRGARDQLATRG